MAQKEKRRFITDFFNTMLDMKWRYVFLIFFLSFFLSWLAFAGVWYVIVFAHGDLDEGHLPEQQVQYTKYVQLSAYVQFIDPVFISAGCFRVVSLRVQHPQFRLVLPVQRGDAAHDWLRRATDDRAVSGGHSRHELPERHRGHHTGSKPRCLSRVYASMKIVL